MSRPDQQHGRPPPVGPRARIKVSVPVIEGSLDVELIRRVLRRHRRQWLYCYEQLQSKAPEDAKPAESVVRFKIAAGGRVTMAVAKGDQDKLDACLARSTRRFRFPAPPKKDSVSVKVTASFTPVQ